MVRGAFAFVVLALAALCAAMVPARAGDDPAAADRAGVRELLAQADALRSADRVRFEQALEQLYARRDSLDLAELQQLQYLRAYWLIVFGNDVTAGIARAQSLFHEAADPDLRFRAGSLVANSFAINRDFAEGLRFLEKTLPKRHEVDDRDIRHDGTNVAAALYNQLGQYTLAKTYAAETLADAPAPRAACFAGHFSLEARLRLGQLGEDDASAREMLAKCEAIGEGVVAGIIRTNLARHLAATGRPSEAITLLQQTVDKVTAIGYPWLVAEYRSLLSVLLEESGDIQGATRNAEAAVAQAAGIDGARAIADAYRVLYVIAERAGRPQEALEYFRKYAEADKAWLNEVKTRELAYQIVRQETSQKNQQIELLNQQNELLRLQQRVQEQEATNSRLLVLLLLVALATICYWAYKTKRMQRSLRHLAENDPLTGARNRHFFTQRAKQLFTAPGDEPVSLVMFDLDGFKLINDGFGHATGDWALVRVVEVCRALCTPRDCFARIGGEEFAILIPGADIARARHVAEECRARLAAIDSAESGHVFTVTASFGVTCSELAGRDLTSMMSQADRMLYRAKREGRNRVCVHELPRAVVEDLPERLSSSGADSDARSRVAAV
ncbi:sensor domain-containing diguanylate cyclase [Luteimonas terricola]|uniref:diguanylate cyclase n=1 Tax=Luteimonas terricola TaxID=645597 RepID=A0ABQ2EBQ7_9GAMM|nr:GGDEF domain-containing protein [Luteimonas terricola]GGK04192.1 GGDEF domain-containing protein [Luteimonas terricola]